MKKRVTLLLVIMLTVLCACAHADKARYLSRDGDKAYHSSHLAMHAGLEDCRICGNYLKVRNRASGNASVIGHVEQADLVRLQEISGGWARILVLYSSETSPDSYAGLEGWVDAAYVECGCSERTYYAGSVDAVQGGEVTGGGVNLREQPSGSSRSLGKLSRGERVRVFGRYASGGKTFYRVVRTSGQSGFVSAEYLDVGGSVPAMVYAAGSDDTMYAGSVTGNDWTEILNRYYRAIRDGDDTILAEPYIELSQAAYLFKDVDGDGDPELMILESAGDASQTGIDENNLIIACYTRKNGQIVHIFDGWSRNRYSLCKDGSFYNRGSNGADNSIEAIYRLSGTRLKGVRAVYDQGNNVYFADSDPAIAKWGDFDVNPVSLGARKISWAEFSSVSTQMQTAVLFNLSGVQYFRDYR